MEASYEVLGDAPSESASASEEAEEESPGEAQNGEVVRAEVETFAKAGLVQTVLAAAGFAISVVGIWGDGASRVLQSETVVFGM